MKKIISLVLAFILIAALGTTAFADSSQTTSTDIKVEFEVNTSHESYEVVIPASISASTARPNELDSFGFRGVNIVSSRVLTMSVSSRNSWELLNSQGDSLSYCLMNSSGAALSGAVVSIRGQGLEANASASESYYALITDGIGSVAHLGNFSDLLTFTFEVSDIAA